jgi:benzoyl-CoA reductase/2-hydroxyglutaryl-CoA dehydratase subunit BcrC/BadD/HgdB
MAIPSELRDLCKNPATILSRYKDSGVKVIGYTCSYVPEELIISAGLQPYRITNIGANVSALTPSFVCPFASAVLENMVRLEGFFDGFVIAHTCDPMWRLYDILKKKISKPLFLLRVPHNTDNEHSFEFFKLELMRFRKFLEENFSSRIDENALFGATRLCNENRSLLKSIYMLNDNGRFKINALDRFPLVLASMWMPKKEINDQIKTLHFNHSKRDGEVRLHLNGTSIYDMDLIRIIGESGGFVVSDDLCTGSRYFWSNVEKSEDPISALAYRYLKRTPCPSDGPIEDRLEYINFMVKEFRAQGVITFAERFCDPILYDSVHIRDMLSKNGVATTLIDYENTTQEIGRIKTRVEAFVESIGG